MGLDVVEREGRFYVQSQRYVQSEDEICSFLQNNIGTQLLYEEILANLYVKGGSKAFLEILRCSAQEPELQSLRDGSAEFLRKIADNILWIADSAKAREFLSEAKQLFPPMQWAIEQIQIDLEQTVKDREKVLPDIDRRIAALEKNLQGQDIESLFIYNSLIDGQPFDGAYYEKAFLLSQLGRRQEAITMVLSAYQRAREKFPERAKNLFEWEIDILGSLMAYEEGLRLCDEAIRQFPHHDGFKKEQAYLLRKQAVPPPSA